MKIKYERGLVDKPNISRFIDNYDLDKKVEAITIKLEVKAVQDKITK